MKKFGDMSLSELNSKIEQADQKLDKNLKALDNPDTTPEEQSLLRRAIYFITNWTTKLKNEEARRYEAGETFKEDSNE